MALPSPSLNCVSRCHTKLPRSAMVLRAVAAPSRPLKSAVPELLDGPLHEQSVNFQEYAQATQMLNRLKGQASDLELLLDQMNALDVSLDDNILAPPPPAEEQAARQAKRAAKRAARKAQAASAAVAEPAAAAPLRPSTGPTSTTEATSSSFSGPSATAHALDSDSRRRVSEQEPLLSTGSTAPSSSSHGAPGPALDLQQQLEELLKITVSEPDLPRASSSSAPILRPRKAAGPKLLRPATAAPPTKSRPAPASTPAPGFTDPLEEMFGLGPSPSSSSAGLAAPSTPSISAPPASPDTAGHLFDEFEEGDLGAAGMSYSGPSDEELLALDQQAGALGLDGEDELLDIPGRTSAAAAGARELEASAMVSRAPEQVSVSATGPSLLSLVPVAAQPSGRGAQSRQARRSARNGGAGRGRVVAQTETTALNRFSKDGTGQFLSQSSSLLLTAEREREVTQMTKDFLFLEKVKRQCQKTLHRRPTLEELSSAVGMTPSAFSLRYQTGLQAKELLLKCNYRFVMTVCRGHLGKGMALQDMVSEGVKGLLRAAELYDVTKGYRFGTYAHWWIRQAITRAMAETGRGVRLPTNMIEQLTRLKQVTAQLSNSLSRDPTVEELATAAKLSVERVQQLLEAARRNASLDTPMGGTEDGGTLMDSLQDDRNAADEEFGEASLHEDLESVLGKLPAREAQVLRLRFGLEDGEEKTLEEVGERIGVTRERIRQMEAKALRMLQLAAAERDNKLQEYQNNMGMLEGKELAARSSLGTKKT